MSKATKSAAGADRTTKPPKRKAGTFDRVTHVIDRTQEFFTPDELSKQIGHAPQSWAAALLKEAVDNGLDAAETAGDGRHPVVTVTVEADRLTVADNGGGIPPEVVASSLDFSTRTTDKAVYVSPTRGRQGNALKTLWAAPFVAGGGDPATVTVEARGVRHVVAVANDPIDGKPELTHDQAEGGRTVGTRLALDWPGVAEDLTAATHAHHFDADANIFDAELSLGMRSADALLRAYSLFNPHAEFRLAYPGREPLTLPVRDPGFVKWRADQASPPQWYTVEQFEQLVAALVRAARRAGEPVPNVRDFLATFRGLSSTAKQKAVRDAAGLAAGATLDDLLAGGRPDREAIQRLHAAAVAEARDVQPGDLGVIGKAVFVSGLQDLFGADQAVGYRKAAGFVGALPFVLEVAFGVSQRDDAGRCAVTGVNWSPALRLPLEGLADALQDNRVDEDDPAVIAVHLAFPGATATDRGKSRYELPGEILDAMVGAVKEVTKGWRKAKADRERHGRRLDKEKLVELRRGTRTAKRRIKDAAYEVMAEAYAQASGTVGVADARQVMYSARSLIDARFGIECVWKNSKDFTQRHLPDYLADNPETTAGWDVVFDERGHIAEPHTGYRIGLGTVSVRNYLAEWQRPDPTGRMDGFRIDHAYPTRGPLNRYENVLFVEKEGFDHVLRRARVQERFDIGLMSTKGMTVTAARLLIDRLSAAGVTIYVLHDFDKSGLGILHTMQTSARRYQFTSKPRVVDLGLRLPDVKKLGLVSETVRYDRAVTDPRHRLKVYGATRDERNFLVRRRLNERTWEGERVELNAMTSDQVVAYLEVKFAEHGVGKVVPAADTMAAAYQRAARIVRVEAAIESAVADANREVVAVPDGIAEAVAAHQLDHPELSWDEAVYRIVAGRAR